MNRLSFVAALLMTLGCTGMETAVETDVELKTGCSVSGVNLSTASIADASVYDESKSGAKLSCVNGTFSGKVSERNMYYLAAPSAGVVTWEKGAKLQYEIPDLQILPENSADGLAENARFYVGRTPAGSSSVDLVPAQAILQFTFDEHSPLASSITVKGASLSHLTGKYKASLVSTDFPAVAYLSGGKSEVTLRSFDGECPLPEGNCFIAVGPGSYPQGLSLSINGTDGNVVEKALNSLPQELKAGVCYDCGVVRGTAEGGGSTPEPPADLEKIGDYYDIYLLIGQSNMAGRGTLTTEDKAETVKGVYLLDASGKPTPATHPFNQYSTIRKDLSMQQMNPGYGFSTTLLKYRSERPILIVCNARGGTSITEWAKGKSYYNEAITRTKLAMQYGTLKGILWHQGCSDGSRVDSYLSLLNAMVTSMRTDLSAPSVPFIAGELAQWRAGSPAFNTMLHGISSVVSNSAWVSSEGCGMLLNESDPHFNREGQILIGQRYAEKMNTMLGAK